MFQTANPCKEIQDSLGFHAVQDSWFSVFVSGTWIPDSLSCIPDCKAQDSGFHLNILLDLGFQNPDSLTGKKNGLWTDFLYYNRTTSLHVQRTFQLTSEYHCWRMLQIHLASSDPRVRNDPCHNYKKIPFLFCKISRILKVKRCNMIKYFF